MNKNEFMIDLLGKLDQKKSQKQINKDIKEIEKTINMLRLTATLARGSSKKEINAYIEQLSDQLSTIKLKAQIDSKNLKSEIDKALNNVSFKDIDILNIDENKPKLKVRKVIADAKAYVEKNPISVGVNIESKKSKLDNDLTTYLNKYTKINESSALLKEADKVRDLIGAVNDNKSLRDATDAFRLYKSEVSATGYATKSTADRIKAMFGHITKLGSIFSVTSLAVNNFTKSLGTLKDIDDILTEISKTSDLTSQELEKLGNVSFRSASKYGKTASDYLLGIQEMSRSGFYGEKGTAMAEQSLLAQAAGDMTAEVANKYILATNAAYKYNGEAKKLNAVLDGQNSITNRNSVALSDMAIAMSETGTVASSYRVSIEDLSAMIGTMEAVTKAGGSEVGNSIKSILVNLQNVTSSKITDTLDAANASMTEFVNGTEKLRDPISILRDLAETFNQLDEDDALRAEILTNIGGKHQAAKLAALLQNMELFDKMLVDYSEGAGSAMEEAMKSANNWSGKLNQIQNSWHSLVSSIISNDTVLNGLTFGDKLIQGIEGMIEKFGVIPTILTAVNSSMVAMNKDYGLTKIWDKDTKKIDLEGNIFGIDFSAIKNLKNQKKHLEEVKEAVQLWNDAMLNGENDLESFSSSLAKNNSQFKAYLQTTSKDAPASLKGYRQYLQDTGQATEELRLKTILLNSALTFLGSIAVQAVIKGIATAYDRFNVTVTESKEAVDGVNSKISDLKAQLEELNDLEYKSDFDRQKISQLEKELELQERILEVEQKRLYQNQVGTSFSDYFDKESLVAKQQEQYNRYNKEGYEYLSMRFELDRTSLEETEAELSSLQEKLENGALAGHERFVVEGKIAELTEKRNDFLEDQQKVEDQLTLNMGEYLKNYQTAQEAAESGLLTGDDLEKAKSMAEFWNQMYRDSSEMVINIQKMNGRYDNTNDLLEERFSNISRDDLISLSDDDKRIALSFDPDNIIGFEELQEKIAETKGDIEEFNRTEISITPTISSSVQQLSGQLEPQFAKLGEAYQAIFADDGFSLDAVDNSMLEGLRSSFAEIGDEVGVAFDPSVLEPFFDTLTNKSSKLDDVQKAFDNLATAYFYSTGTLEQLNDETADAIEKQLEEMGVQNASEVVAEALAAKTEELAVAKEFLAQKGYELSAASADEANAFILEQIEAGNCSEALAILQLKKMLVNGTLLDTSTDINNVLSLAKAAGVAVDSLGILVELKARFDSAMASGNYGSAAVLNGQIAIYKAQIESEIANFSPVGLDFKKFGGGASKAKSAGKDAGKAYKDALKEELSDLESVISGITGKIDDQISVIKTQKEAALESIDAQIDALNEQKSLLEDQKKALEEARDAAVEALEDERDARIEIIEAQKGQLGQQIKLIEKQIKDKEKVIKGIQDEIDAMEDANEQRKRQIDLQKAQYELERLQHQRTILQYSEEKGMHYVTDTKDIRDKKQAVDDAKLEIEIANKQKQIDLIEKEIDLLNEKKDAINEQISLLDEEIDRVNKFYDAEIEKTKELYDSQIKAIDTQIEAIDRQIESIQKQREQTEQYYESLIGNLEKSKSKYEELTEILGQAELSAKLQQLGIDEEALLNGSAEEFEKLKNAYMDVVFRLNEGNAEVLSKLQELSGYEGTAPTVLADSNVKLDEMNSKLGESSQSVGSVNSSLGETATSTGEVAANVGAISDSLNQMPGSEKIKGLSDGFGTLAEAIGKVAGALGISGDSPVSSITQALSNLNSATLGGESEGIIGQFALLKAAIMDVIDTIGLSGAESVNSLMQAIAGLGEISLDKNIITQFDNLKTAVEGVVSAISGGGVPNGSNSGSSDKGKGSGTGGTGGLTGAIEGIRSATDKALSGGGGGENGEGPEGGGTGAIGQFGQLKTAVDDAAASIGSGADENAENKNSNTLIGSINSLGTSVNDTLGESGGTGAIGKFEQFKQPIQEAQDHVNGIYEGLEDIDNEEVECTIKVNIETTGGLPKFAEGTLGDMNLESGEYNAKYGRAFAEGTGKYKGLPRDEENALVSEYGQTEMTVLPDGKTIITDEPTMMDLPKDTVVFNEEQTKKILDNKIDASGNAHPGNQGTDDAENVPGIPEGYEKISLMDFIRGLQDKNPADRKDIRTGEVNVEDRSLDTRRSDAFIEDALKQMVNPVHIVTGHMEKMANAAEQIGNMNNISNVMNKPSVTIGDIHVTCPGVTSQQVAEQVGYVIGDELNRQFNGFHNYTDQMSRVR